MNYHDLEKTKVSELRELLKEKDPEFKGVSGLKKEQLVEVVAEKLGIEKPHKVVVGADKGAIKARIRELKKTKAGAVQAGDRVDLRSVRKELHGLRRQLRKATRITA